MSIIASCLPSPHLGESNSSTEAVQNPTKNRTSPRKKTDYFAPEPRALGTDPPQIDHYGVRFVKPNKIPSTHPTKSTPTKEDLCSLSSIPKGNQIQWDYQRQEPDPKRPGFGRQPISAFGYDIAKIPVRYFSAAERALFKVSVEDESLVTPSGQSLITNPKAKEHLFIIGADDSMYVVPVHHKLSAFLGKLTHQELRQHSSVMNGQDVKFAGTVKTHLDEDGKSKITYFDNDSGHYKPNRQQFNMAIEAIKAQGLFAENAQATFLEFISRKEINKQEIDP